jgi:hypothetical protein
VQVVNREPETGSPTRAGGGTRVWYEVAFGCEARWTFQETSESALPVQDRPQVFMSLIIRVHPGWFKICPAVGDSGVHVVGAVDAESRRLGSATASVCPGACHVSSLRHGPQIHVQTALQGTPDIPGSRYPAHLRLVGVKAAFGLGHWLARGQETGRKIVDWILNAGSCGDWLVAMSIRPGPAWILRRDAVLDRTGLRKIAEDGLPKHAGVAARCALGRRAGQES